jgi:hypothetical protein
MRFTARPRQQQGCSPDASQLGRASVSRQGYETEKSLDVATIELLEFGDPGAEKVAMGLLADALKRDPNAAKEVGLVWSVVPAFSFGYGCLEIRHVSCIAAERLVYGCTAV